MQSAMRYHIVLHFELLATEIAAKWFLSSMDPQMVLQTMRLSEGFGAKLTAIRLLSSVHSQMLVQVGFASKAFGAERTAQRLRRVYDEMYLQVRFVFELLFANLA